MIKLVLSASFSIFDSVETRLATAIQDVPMLRLLTNEINPITNTCQLELEIGTSVTHPSQIFRSSLVPCTMSLSS